VSETFPDKKEAGDNPDATRDKKMATEQARKFILHVVKSSKK
jgi:hypothetical protein